MKRYRKGFWGLLADIHQDFRFEISGALFVVGLFAVEPLILDRYFRKWATTRPDGAFKWLQIVHWILLALSLVTVCGAVAGSHGWSVS